MGQPDGRERCESPVRSSGPEKELELRSGSADTWGVENTERPYDIEARPTLVRQMRGIPTNDQVRILARIEALATDPRPAGVTKLTDVEGWRVRVGDYRITYLIDDTVRVVTITRIGQRGSIYRRR